MSATQFLLLGALLLASLATLPAPLQRLQLLRLPLLLLSLRPVQFCQQERQDPVPTPQTAALTSYASLTANASALLDMPKLAPTANLRTNALQGIPMTATEMPIAKTLIHLQAMPARVDWDLKMSLAVPSLVPTANRLINASWDLMIAPMVWFASTGSHHAGGTVSIKLQHQPQHQPQHQLVEERGAIATSMSRTFMSEHRKIELI